MGYYGWEPIEDIIHPYQHKFDCGIKRIYKSLHKAYPKEIREVLDEQVEHMIAWADDHEDLQSMMLKVFEIELDEEEAEMLYYGEERWLEDNYPDYSDEYGC